MATRIERPEIRTVLSTLNWRLEEINQIRQALRPAKLVQCDPNDKDSISAVLQHAEAAILGGDLDDSILSAPNLAWVHCDHAGLNKSARPETFAKGLLVTGSAGRSGPALAQHGFFFALNLTYGIQTVISRQAAHQWEGGNELRERGALWGRRLGIVGFGHTGREMARIGRAFGMHVTVLRRSRGDKSPDVNVMLSTEAGDGLDLILKSDVVMLATSLSDLTYHLFSTEQFRRMKNSAIIVNMARGPVIDEEALIQALEKGEIAGAGLDVFETEPLPTSSPLWGLPNVLITPHSTPQLPDRTQRSIDIILENLKRYREGFPLVNAIDKRDMYTKR